MVVIGMVIGMTGLAYVGVALFGAFVAFTLVTLPVEFDASIRARRVLEQRGLLKGEELRGVRAVLTAAAATYLASAVSAVLQLVYWLLRVGLIGGGRDD
jgi:Zn-dependent membrane protease YugP